MHMKLEKGRDFYAGNTDSTNVIINQSMATLMGKEEKLAALLHPESIS